MFNYVLEKAAVVREQADLHIITRKQFDHQYTDFLTQPLPAIIGEFTWAFHTYKQDKWSLRLVYICNDYYGRLPAGCHTVLKDEWGDWAVELTINSDSTLVLVYTLQFNEFAVRTTPTWFELINKDGDYLNVEIQEDQLLSITVGYEKEHGYDYCTLEDVQPDLLVDLINQWRQ